MFNSSSIVALAGNGKAMCSAFYQTTPNLIKRNKDGRFKNI